MENIVEGRISKSRLRICDTVCVFKMDSRSDMENERSLCKEVNRGV